MKRKTLVMTAVTLFAAVAVCIAANDAFMGSWKLNEAKSKFSAVATKNSMVVYAAAGDSVKITADGTTADGKAVHVEWTGKFDGKPYPTVGDATIDTRTYKVINDHTLSTVAKKGEKVVSSGQIVVSADGKSRTVTTTQTDDKGMKMSNTAVYDKQ
jgi:hypothetical protein